MNATHLPKSQAPTDEIERLRSLFTQASYEPEGLLPDHPVRGTIDRILDLFQPRSQKKAMVERVGVSNRVSWPLGS